MDFVSAGDVRAVLVTSLRHEATESRTGAAAEPTTVVVVRALGPTNLSTASRQRLPWPSLAVAMTSSLPGRIPFDWH